MDVESFKLSVTDPIQPLLPNLFFSPTLIFQLWESNFPVTQAENSNTNRGSIFNSSLRTPAQPLSRSHWFCVWFLSHSSFPLTPTWFGFSLSLSSHLSSVLFFFFFWHHCQFCLCPTALPRPPEEGPLSASPLTPHPEPSQAQTTCLVIAAQSRPFVVITLLFQKFSGPQLLSKSRQAKGLDFSRLAPTSLFYCFHTYYALDRSSVFCKPASFILAHCTFAHVFSFA